MQCRKENQHHQQQRWLTANVMDKTRAFHKQQSAMASRVSYRTNENYRQQQSQRQRYVYKNTWTCFHRPILDTKLSCQGYKIHPLHC